MKKHFLIITCILFLFIVNTNAQNNVPEEMWPFLKDVFPHQLHDAYKGYKRTDGKYYGAVEIGNIEYSVLMDSEFNIVYYHHFCIVPNIKQFKKEFISTIALKAIQKKMATKHKNINIGFWIGEYYLNQTTNVRIIELHEYVNEDHPKYPTLPSYFFDENGKYLFQGNQNIELILLKNH